ncbi:hypothetical protein BHAOGJBA_1733 [Methylobacterium hispanicum]|uniref:Uncharacterized protein n=2 Tax=Methylobacterium TaxID=407 RepID=A0AAV4ZID3_9HYPH|nr:hypothetical protein [Methylobacterium hispanicum]GJD88220.1 hypothetical protein BHAOGJBA_1733 [Methylobacterium hispanicum]
MSARRHPCYLIDEDTTDYEWSATKLDELLADPEVEGLAADMLSYGFKRGEFDPDPVYRQCRREYRRKEPAALLFFLAARLFERLQATARSTGGAS